MGRSGPDGDLGTHVHHAAHAHSLAGLAQGREVAWLVAALITAAHTLSASEA